MSSPFPPSSPDPFGKDPFGNDPLNPSSDPFVTKRRGSGRGGYVLALLVLFAAIGGVTWWVLSRVLDENEEASVRPLPPAVTAVPVTVGPGGTDPGGGTSPEATAPVDTAPVETPPTTEGYIPPDTYMAAVGRDALVAAAEELGVDPLRLLEVVLYPEYVIFQFQVPDEPEFVDRATWRRGSVSSRDPVRLSPNTDLDVELFGLDDVDWSALDALVASAVELTEVRDGQVSHVIVTRFLPFFDDVRFRVYVSGPRTSGSVEAAADGTVTRVFAAS